MALQDPSYELTTKGGRTRSYIVHTPAGWDGTTPLSVVLGFHGGAGHGAGFERQSGFVKVADDNGFLLVCPNGTNENPGATSLLDWNAGSCCGAPAQQRR